MAPMIKRRNIVDGPASRILATKSITKFGRVSKASSLQIQLKKDILLDLVDEKIHKPVSQAVKSKKRSREEDGSDQELREQSENITRVPLDSSDRKIHRKKARFENTQENIYNLTQSPLKVNSLTLENLNISKPGQVAEIFDEEVQDLIDLHVAFLNALAIHYAHNGTASPVDLRVLIPQIELKWGKRRILVEDIQRLLGIQHLDAQSALSLVQKTKSRVCIEYDSNVTNILPVETLKRVFKTACGRLQGKEFPTESIRIETPRENVPLSKGAQRLLEIKASAIQAQPSATPAISTLQQTPTTQAPVNRAASLLDRIRNKETLLSNLPAGPTPEAQARQASLQRLEEMIPILCVLSGSNASLVSSRNLYTSTTSLASLSSLGSSLGLGPAAPAKVVSFTMANVIQHLQNSMRHPMAREAIERSIRILAEEVAPRWISVRDVGSVVGVTFRGKIGRTEWAARLKELLLLG